MKGWYFFSSLSPSSHPCVYFCLYFFIFLKFIYLGCLYAGFELSSFCLSFPIIKIKGMCHHIWVYVFLQKREKTQDFSSLFYFYFWGSLSRGSDWFPTSFVIKDDLEVFLIFLLLQILGLFPWATTPDNSVPLEINLLFGDWKDGLLSLV